MNYKPEISAFASGALVMIFEILGARILGSYTGNSLFVWTSIIALILGALAAGYYLGGELADKKISNSKRYSLISLLFLGAGLNFLFLPYISDALLTIITTYIHDIRISSLIGTFFLFVPASFLLGMIAPICTKIQLTSLDSSGKVVGRIGSLGTLGSILGTIAAGFFLIPFFGVRTLLILLALCCLIISILNTPKKHTLLHIFIGIFIGVTFFVFTLSQKNLKQDGMVEIESPYSHITLIDQEIDYRLVRNMYVDNINHSGMYLDGNDLYAPYTKAYHLFTSFVPEAENVLMLGGAAYSFPKSFLLNYPDKNIDVVEIDETMTELAKKYFYLEESPRLHSYHQDARVYLNTTEKKYDAILGDAFGSYFSIPFQLTTLETVQKKYDILTENGVVILNTIASQSGKASKFLQAEYLTYKEVFPEVFIIPIRSTQKEKIQNIMLVAAKNPQTLSYTHGNSELQSLLDNKTYLDIDENTKILTDDYAPVDYYISMLSN